MDKVFYRTVILVSYEQVYISSPSGAEVRTNIVDKVLYNYNELIF
jgi:hypothetical protein